MSFFILSKEKLFDLFVYSFIKTKNASSFV